MIPIISTLEKLFNIKISYHFNVRKRIFGHVLLAKIQISLRDQSLQKNSKNKNQDIRELKNVFMADAGSIWDKIRCRV